MSSSARVSLARRLAGYFLRGLVITAPVALTIWITWTVINWVDDLLGIPIPGVGLVVVLVAMTAVGALASSLLARSLLGAVEDLLERVPFVRLLYTSSKDLLNAFVGEKRRFTRAVRVALSEDGAIFTLGFVTADALDALDLHGHVAVYLPQSYNFAGQLVIVPASRITPVPMDSADVMAFIVSGGVSGAGGA
jgi:uncharacterized membrane protein